MKKSLALSLVINFGRDEEHELLKEGRVREAYQIESARRTLHHALIKSANNISITLDKMLNYSHDDNGMVIEDPTLWVSDMYTRSLLAVFRENWNNIQNTKKRLYEVREIKLNTASNLDEYQEAFHMSTAHICAGLDEVKTFCGTNKLHKRSGNYIVLTDDTEFVITRLIK